MQAALDVVFLLVPKFSMISLYGALEPLRVANQCAGQQFSWRFVSVDGAPIAASNAIPVSVSGSVRDIGQPAMVVVLASYDHEVGFSRAILAAMRALARAKVLLAGIDTGPFILAQAGVLDHHRATCHWQSLPGFRESYAKVECRQSLYELDDLRMTCAGGSASIDMMLEWIGQRAGRKIAFEVADQLIHSRGSEVQKEARLPMAARFGTAHPKLLAALTIMEDHIEEPLFADELALRVGLSLRSFERMFSDELQKGPMKIYLQIRLERAKRLLEYSHLTVRDIGVATGFASLPVFSRCFKQAFGKAPSVWRADTH